MLDQNTIMITGTVVKELELRHGNSGLAFVNINIANNYAWNKVEKKNESQFFKLSAFGEQAEKYCEQIKKGNRISVMGKLKTKKYESNGNVYVENEIYDYKLEVLAVKDYKKKDKGNTGVDEVEEPNADFDNDDEPFPFE